jgi:hypothetical protein
MSEARARRDKKSVNYAREQVFSDAEDIFEDSDDEPVVKRGRVKSRKSRDANAPMIVEPEELDDDGVYRPPKPIYTEKGYDPSLAPIRERFPFLPEFEPDGSPRIDLIVGRRPVDEKESNANDESSDNEDLELSDEDVMSEEETGGGKKRGRRQATKKRGSAKSLSPSKNNQDSAPAEYEYLIKYKNRSYLHLEWKTGADLESMNKSAKTIYRRYLKKLASGADEDLEDPEFDPSYAEPQKIVDAAEQEITVELSDKELLEWEKGREKALAEETSGDEMEDDGPQNGDAKKGEIEGKGNKTPEEQKGMYARVPC